MGATRRKRLSPPPPAPAPKRERRPSPPPPRRPLAETARAAWDVLSARHPTRAEFSADELQREAEAEWALCRNADKRVAAWRRDWAKFVKKEKGMFKKADKDGMLVMANRAFTAPGGKRKGKKAELGELDGPEGVRWLNFVPDEWRVPGVKPVRLSTVDRSPAISDDVDGAVRGKKGYRMVRATAGVVEGDWYFEMRVVQSREKGNVRVGWSTRRSDVETPVGSDAYGFAVRDLTGECVHQGRRRAYMQPFSEGDVVGCRIRLPVLQEELKKKVGAAEEALLQHRLTPFVQGSSPPDSGVDMGVYGVFEFFLNGVSMGQPNFYVTLETPKKCGKVETDEKQAQSEKGNTGAAEAVRKDQEPLNRSHGVKGGRYYPSVALFRDAVARANFGPNFEYPIPAGTQGMYEAVPDPPKEPEISRADGENGDVDSVKPDEKKNAEAKNPADKEDKVERVKAGEDDNTIEDAKADEVASPRQVASENLVSVNVEDTMTANLTPASPWRDSFSSGQDTPLIMNEK